jgi:hypothetical protein
LTNPAEGVRRNAKPKALPRFAGRVTINQALALLAVLFFDDHPEWALST